MLVGHAEILSRAQVGAVLVRIGWAVLGEQISLHI